uniref:4 kDa protein n=1 Tax=Grapevine leafroll-associated virus 3 TaxID=55951 RepID=E5KGG4_9CLOS|nr:4 kDa protein [Grapevine leafroll-associated virus 3]ADQ57501.1 4 kDa protein [Grapevine leafroll-associated virus 3]ADQ57508.1 4 kDa protein [Grapevine leafroll-associated virus 3]ADQ57515.1 4 kDa protein [Grapevine leafroll-associated virus 3]
MLCCSAVVKSSIGLRLTLLICAFLLAVLVVSFCRRR